MAGGARDGDDDGIITDINVTPLVDVTLVLLIILMVTAQQVVAKTIPVELPNSARPEQTQPQATTLAISIDAEGHLFLDTQPIDLATLRNRAQAAHDRDPENVRAIIAADTRVTHGKVVEVIDTLRQADVVKFAINVRQSDLPAR